GLTFEWRALRDLDAHYALSIHLVDRAGRRWGQGDAWILDEDLIPTAGWHAGEVHRQQVMLGVYAGTPPGSYEALIRVKDRLSGETLPAASRREGSPEGMASLGQLWVAPSPLVPDPEKDLAIQNRLNERLIEGLALLGWGMEMPPRFGDRWSVALYWRADGPIDADYAVELELVDEDGRLWARGLYDVASEAYPTSMWNPGQVLWRFCDLQVAEDALAGQAQLRLALVGASGERVTWPLSLGSVSVVGHRFERPRIPYEQGATIGGGERDGSIRLLGYALDRTELKPGGALELVLYWQATSETDASLTVFTHLLDGAGAVRGQLDSVPMEGYYPTNAWQVGEIIEDRYALALDADAPPGEYVIEVGMYDPAAGAGRQPLFDANGVRQQDDRLLLDQSIGVR
ncbi:MAG: hypothetical protein JXA74_07655, partial [Anaerolineae bacterium]|nr:hypothetical protein [Anaerolineae bacterium]